MYRRVTDLGSPWIPSLITPRIVTRPGPTPAHTLPVAQFVGGQRHGSTIGIPDPAPATIDTVDVAEGPPLFASDFAPRPRELRHQRRLMTLGRVDQRAHDHRSPPSYTHVMNSARNSDSDSLDCTGR